MTAVLNIFFLFQNTIHHFWIYYFSKYETSNKSLTGCIEVVFCGSILTFQEMFIKLQVKVFIKQ